MGSSFDIAKLFRDVVNPLKGEVITFLVDHPHGEIKSTDAWVDRRKMAEEWHAGIRDLCREVGAVLNPIVSYPATGAGNADLPHEAVIDGKSAVLEDVLKKTNICFALTQYSASAPLIMFGKKFPSFRAASLPGVKRSMEQTALAADYTEVAKMAQALTKRLTRAESAHTIFSTGHEFTFDLRFRVADSDDGYLHADKTGIRVINLPSGEGCIVPYEGEHPGEPSRTAGELPVKLETDTIVLKVKGNRIVGGEGSDFGSQEFMQVLAVDPARRNIAELGLGCNPQAVITGNVLEDEKVGFHWAFGRSEHLGGVIGPKQFAKPENVLHTDIVYAGNSPITVKKLTLKYPEGGEEIIIEDGKYTVFDS